MELGSHTTRTVGLPNAHKNKADPCWEPGIFAAKRKRGVSSVATYAVARCIGERTNQQGHRDRPCATPVKLLTDRVRDPTSAAESQGRGGFSDSGFLGRSRRRRTDDQMPEVRDGDRRYEASPLVIRLTQLGVIHKDDADLGLGLGLIWRVVRFLIPVVVIFLALVTLAVVVRVVVLVYHWLPL